MGMRMLLFVVPSSLTSFFLFVSGKISKRQSHVEVDRVLALTNPKATVNRVRCMIRGNNRAATRMMHQIGSFTALLIPPPVAPALCRPILFMLGIFNGKLDNVGSDFMSGHLVGPGNGGRQGSGHRDGGRQYFNLR